MKLRNNGIISKGEYENRTLEDAIEYANFVASHKNCWK
jgi:hypothetical protein